MASVHRLIDNAVHGVGDPGGGKASQQGPQLRPRIKKESQQTGHRQKNQRLTHLPPVRPTVVIEKARSHCPTPIRFFSAYAGEAVFYFSSLTMALNTCPRSMKFAKRSKEVLAGDKITTSPGWERASAMDTASW